MLIIGTKSGILSVMTCPQCKNLMVKAKATNFGEEYDYCRTCKKELKEMAETNNDVLADPYWLNIADTVLFAVDKSPSVPNPSGGQLWPLLYPVRKS